MAKFWTWMIEIYSNKWTGGYGVDPSKAWSEGLQNVDPRQIRHGVDKCVSKGLAWPPSLPQFMDLCKYDAADICAPSMEEAYQEACNLGKDILRKSTTGPMMTVGKEWTHAAIYHAYTSIDGWQFIDNEKQKRSIFETKYNQIIDRIVSGEQLEKPEPILALEKNPSGVKVKGGSMTTGEDAIKAMKEKLNQSTFVKK